MSTLAVKPKTEFTPPSNFQILKDSLKKEVSAIKEICLKLPISVIAWRETLAVILPERYTKLYAFPVKLAQKLDSFRNMCKITKNTLEISELPKAVEALGTSAVSGKTTDFMHEVADKVHTFYDLAEVLVSQGIIDICKTSMSYFGSVNSAALLYTQGLEASKQYDKYHMTSGTPEDKQLAWYKGSKAVSNIAIATLGLIGFTLGTVFKVPLLVCSTSALYYSIRARFYEKAQDPKALTPERVACC